jgi:hypothetical protein
MAISFNPLNDPVHLVNSLKIQTKQTQEKEVNFVLFVHLTGWVDTK